MNNANNVNNLNNINNIFNFSAVKTEFGNGAIKNIGIRAKEMNTNRVFILCGQNVAKSGILKTVMNELEKAEINVGIFDKVTPEPPVEIVEEISSEIKKGDYELIIAVGGGSSLDVAKAVSVAATNNRPIDEFFGTNNVSKPGIPTILVPTTSGSGSEVSNVSILTDTKEQLKKGIASPYLYAKLALVDPTLTYTVPPYVTANTGMDALVHAIESYLAKRSNEITDAIALKAIELISENIRTAVTDGENLTARYNMSLGSLMAGISFANVGTAAVHALAYPLGGKYKIPHGTANTVMLKYVMEYNLISRMDKFIKIAVALGEKVEGLSKRDQARKVIKALEELAIDIGVPTRLGDLGIEKKDIPELSKRAIKVQRLLLNNPRKLDIEDIKSIYLKSL